MRRETSLRVQTAYYACHEQSCANGLATAAAPKGVYKLLKQDEISGLMQKFGSGSLEDLISAVAEHRLRNAMACRNWREVSLLTAKIAALTLNYARAREHMMDILGHLVRLAAIETAENHKALRSTSFTG